MRFFEKIKLIERIDQLIKLKATGSARDLARRTNLSKSTVYHILDIMREMGAEIEYCSCRRSYYYKRNKTLAIGFVDPHEINGGKSLVSSFFGQRHNKFTTSRA